MDRTLVASIAVLSLVAVPRMAAALPPVVTAPEVVTGAPGTIITFTVTVSDPDGDAIGVFFVSQGAGAPDPVNDPTFTTNADKTVGTFTWMPTSEDVGSEFGGYDWVFHFSAFQVCCREGRLPPGRATTRIILTDTEPQFGSLSGRVSADCPATGTGLLGVSVDAFAVGSGVLAGSSVTDDQGDFSITDLPTGPYTLSILVPLGYSMPVHEVQTEVLGGQDVAVNFALTCLSTASSPRTIGFWKHQVGAILEGRGRGQVDEPTLCDYLDLIESHFNSNAINQVLVYDPPASGLCEDKLFVAMSLLNLQGSVEMISRARQQLTALLLNVAASYVAQTQVVSEDGATLSQAITYCDHLIDNPGGNHESAKSIADAINNGAMLPAGVIPLDTQNIAYRLGQVLEFEAGPSPASGPRAFRFALRSGAPVSLSIFDVSGRLVTRVFDGRLGEGRHTLMWTGRAANGSRPGDGVYFARLATPAETRVVKLIEVGR
jgi:hypothetical protein